MILPGAALLITPGVPELMVAAGSPKLAWLNRLKNSLRNCRRHCSIR